MHQSRNVTFRSLSNTVLTRRMNERHQTLSRQRSAIIRATDGSASMRSCAPFCTAGAENLSWLCNSNTRVRRRFNCTLYNATQAHARTPSRRRRYGFYTPRSCHDYLADERIVHARRIRGRTGWTKKVREEEDDDQGVEEERKAHTRAWFQ